MIKTQNGHFSLWLVDYFGIIGFLLHTRGNVLIYDMIISKDSCLFIWGIMYLFTYYLTVKITTVFNNKEYVLVMSLAHFVNHFFQIWDLCVTGIYVIYYCDFLLYYNSVITESWTYDLIIYKQYI